MRVRKMIKSVFIAWALGVCQSLWAAGNSGWEAEVGKPAGSFLEQAFERGRSADVESAFVSAGLAARAIDRNLSTFWEADTNETAWVAVELKAPTEVSSVFMSWTAAVPEAGVVEVSQDGKTWESVGSFDNGFPGMALLVPCEVVGKVRYVRVACRKRYTKVWNGGDRYKLRELAVNPELPSFMAEYRKPVARDYSDDDALKQADQMLGRMSPDQKLAYLIGNRRGGFSTRPFPEIDLPALRMTDATMGLKQPPNTAFPAAILLAATWDPELAALQGKTIGEEARHNGIQMLLGPGMNIYRDAANGRNYEYLGEDPFLASGMAVAYIRALQREGVIATAKHFAANNIETGKTALNMEISERALREIYFPAFKAAVQQGGAKAVMTAYNLLNGQYCAENPWLIKTVLETEWGFNGILISDWLSTYDPVMCFNAGLCLEMPHERAWDAPLLKALLAAGVISEDELNDKVRTILYTGYSMDAFDRPGVDSSFPAGTAGQAAHAEKIAEEGIVLLKNRDHLLPLSAQEVKKIILTGPMVNELPPSGSGSGAVQYQKGVSPVGIRQAFESILGPGRLVVCATPEAFDALDETEIASADAIVVCVGFNQKGWGTTVPEGECFDRPFGLTREQDDLVARCAKANPRTVVAITAGGGIDMRAWNDSAGAILHTWYTGTTGGTPLAKILFGEINPSGRLPISIECRREDSPAAIYPARSGKSAINGWLLSGISCEEDILVGYRWYDTKNLPVLYPFGFGLSYTDFAFSDLGVTVSGRDDSLDVAVLVTVKNTGVRAGKETVQVYVHDRESSFIRPVRELKGFAKVELQAGESRKVTVHLDRCAFMFFDPEQKQWVLEPGEFEIQVGGSSRDLPLREAIGLRSR
jgi:beta-glucosidase